MPPVLYLVRHGQGEHNVNVSPPPYTDHHQLTLSQNSHHIRDPLLTEHGKKQCQDLRDLFQHHEDISLVLASPLKRAIQTAAHAFSPVLETRQVPFVLVPLAQEISHLTCDLGADRECLVRDAPRLIAQGAPSYNVDDLDMTLVDEDWNSKVWSLLSSFLSPDK